jgi:hypothetical protein
MDEHFVSSFGSVTTTYSKYMCHAPEVSGDEFRDKFLSLLLLQDPHQEICQGTLHHMIVNFIIASQQISCHFSPSHSISTESVASAFRFFTSVVQYQPGLVSKFYSSSKPLMIVLGGAFFQFKFREWSA